MRHPSSRSLGSSLLALLFFAVSCAAPRPAASQALDARVGAYALEVLVDGVPVRTFEHAGGSYVLGQAGSRYVLRVRNHYSRRIEVVVTVDGLDVMDGKPGSFAKRGYLVPAYGSVDIEGWRLNMAEAAAFRFAPVAASYAAKTGSARNVGVIGVAVFTERSVAAQPVAPRRPGYEGSYSGGHGSAAPAAEMETRAPAPRAEPAAPASASAPPRTSGGAPRDIGASADEAAPAKGEASASRGSEAKRRTRTGLGTEFGEAVRSSIEEVAFTRASTTPFALLGVRYDDRAGLVALGIDVDGDRRERDLRANANPFPAAPRGFARPPADWRRD